MQAVRAARTSGTHYGSATEALESTAKWLVTAFAAVGALMIGGIQLSGIGTLGRSELPRLALAVGSLTVAGVAVVYMIRRTSGIFMTEWVTLTELSYEAFRRLAASTGEDAGKARRERRDLTKILDEIEYAQEELYGHVARSIPELHRHLREANEHTAKVAANQIELTLPDQEKVFGKAQELRNAARDVVECANYHRTRQQFNDLKGRLWVAVAVVALCLVVFAYATNPPAKSEPVRVQFVSGTS
jgi:hypothetical protein